MYSSITQLLVAIWTYAMLLQATFDQNQASQMHLDPHFLPCIWAASSVISSSLTHVSSYLMLASVVGVYSLPLLNRLRPKEHETPMTRVIGSCAILLILSSALPVLSRTLGNFYFLHFFFYVSKFGHFCDQFWNKAWQTMVYAEFYHGLRL